MNHGSRICAIGLVAALATIMSVVAAPWSGPVVAAPLASGPPGARLLDQIFINLQIVDVVDGVVDGYLDVQGTFGDKLTQPDATDFFNAFATKVNDALPFFTDKPVSTLKLNIIPITDINQYNVGRGFEKVGDAVLLKQNGSWQLSRLSPVRSSK
jgi:hypothetical protein